MALFNRIKNDLQTGFGADGDRYGGRLLQPDGSPNVRKTGVHFWEQTSLFHTMLSISNGRFIALILLFYLGINLLFGSIYYLIGMEHLGGLPSGQTAFEQYVEAFFFSCQTFTTVGYGRVNPTGFLSSSLAAIEALLGVSSLAIVTGLFYGRFSRPRAFLRFSKQVILAPFKEGKALMFRVAPFKNSVLTEVEVRLTLMIQETEHGKKVNRFYPLPTEYPKINSLTLSWTIVHPIDEASPLRDFTEDQLKTTPWELIVYIKGFDDRFSNTVVRWISYTHSELETQCKFVPMFYRDEDAGTTILDLNKLSETVSVKPA